MRWEYQFLPTHPKKPPRGPGERTQHTGPERVGDGGSAAIRKGDHHHAQAPSHSSGKRGLTDLGPSGSQSFSRATQLESGPAGLSLTVGMTGGGVGFLKAGAVLSVVARHLPSKDQPAPHS